MLNKVLFYCVLAWISSKADAGGVDGKFSLMVFASDLDEPKEFLY